MGWGRCAPDPLAKSLCIAHIERGLEDIPRRGERTYNVRLRHLCKVMGTDIPSPLSGTLRVLGWGSQNALYIPVLRHSQRGLRRGRSEARILERREEGNALLYIQGRRTISLATPAFGSSETSFHIPGSLSPSLKNLGIIPKKQTYK